MKHTKGPNVPPPFPAAANRAIGQWTREWAHCQNIAMRRAHHRQWDSCTSLHMNSMFLQTSQNWQLNWTFSNILLYTQLTKLSSCYNSPHKWISVPVIDQPASFSLSNVKRWQHYNNFPSTGILNTPFKITKIGTKALCSLLFNFLFLFVKIILSFRWSIRAWILW